jgi:outer membrane immunogenic protein
MSRFAKVLLATTVLSAGLTAVAVAADLRPVYKAPPAAMAPVPLAYNWSGFYIGGHAGAGWGDSGDTAFVGGGQIGYNYQFSPNWLIGIEGDFSGTSFSRSEATTTDVDFGGGLVLPVTQNASFDLNWLASVRGRIGYTWDRFMVYFTGGAAWANVDVNATATLLGVQFGTATASGTVSGWVLGGGGEWMFAPNWSVGVEYLHYDFGSISGTATTLGVSEAFSQDVGSVDVVRARLNYKFGDWFGKAPGARY